MIKDTNYVSPEVNVMEIMAEGILCASVPGYGSGSFNDYEELEWN